MKIAMHGIVVLWGKDGPKKAAAQSQFPAYEVLDFMSTMNGMFGTFRADYTGVIWGEIYRRASLKLQMGERVVISTDMPFTHFGVNRISKLATTYDVETYWINCNDEITGDWQAEGAGLPLIDEFTVVTLPKSGPVDWHQSFNGITVIGDVHGNFDAFHATVNWALSHNRLMVFLGDIVDYGDRVLDCLNLAYRHVVAGEALMVIGNHERKIERWWHDREISLTPGNQVTVDAVLALSPAHQKIMESRLNALINHGRYHFHIGQNTFVHGGAAAEIYASHDNRLTGMMGRIALNGERDGSRRTHSWVDDIPAGRTVFVGHTIMTTAAPMVKLNKHGGRAVFMDCGSGKGGVLSAADLVGETLELQNFLRN